MAEQFDPRSGHIRLLNPGAGVGALTAAFVENLLAKPENVKSYLMEFLDKNLFLVSSYLGSYKQTKIQIKGLVSL